MLSQLNYKCINNEIVNIMLLKKKKTLKNNTY